MGFFGMSENGIVTIIYCSSSAFVAFRLTWRNVNASRGSLHKARRDLQLVSVLFRVTRIEVVHLLPGQSASQKAFAQLRGLGYVAWSTTSGRGRHEAGVAAACKAFAIVQHATCKIEGNQPSISATLGHGKH